MEIVEDGNNEILNNQERYFFYILQEVEKIIQDYKITYNEITDNKKTYPKFTKKQFILICQAINNRVFKSNTMLLRDNVYTSRYNTQKVELCYDVFKMLCNYYSVSYTLDTFLLYSGITKEMLVNWLNSGSSPLLKKIHEDITELDDFTMLNSSNSLLRVFYRNNRETERIQQGNTDILPNLLTGAALTSIPDEQKEN